MSDYLTRRLAEFSLSDEEKEEVREYATNAGLETWAPEDESAFCCVISGSNKDGGEDRVSMSLPLEYGFSETLGLLTIVPFLSLRTRGWGKMDELFGRYDGGLIDWEALLEETAELARTAGEEYLNDYHKCAAAMLETGPGDLVGKLIDGQHIAALSARVRELRAQLAESARFLRDVGSGELLTGWLGAVETIVGRSSFDPFSENIGTTTADTTDYGSHHIYTPLLRHGLREGMPPAQALHEAGELLRGAYERPDVIVKAQLGGLAYLLNLREPILSHAAKVRDELDVYEPLLNCAAQSKSPLSDEALEAIRLEAILRNPRERFARDVFVAFHKVCYEIAWAQEKEDEPYFKATHSWRDIFDRAEQKFGPSPFKSFKVWYSSFKQKDRHKAPR